MRISKQIIAGALFGGLTTGAFAAETTVGRWCDKPVPTMTEMNNTITIVVVESGEVQARLRFGDGSKTTESLIEVSPTIYRVEDSAHGDTYRIVESTGGLQLLDNDGIVRTAKRLENKPRPNECGF